ncbi:uncharacterized protein LOC134264781 [Saccostrea cucullata]|uniref:uncharacterized protein LOC134264781 n=1 Tax=Saccostrea cuccullata TaxID=36930 RepID=UPI002ED18E32
MTCRRVYYRNKEQKSKHPEIPAPAPSVSSPKNISLPLQSIGGSHSCCLVCKRRGPKLIVVSETVRFNFFVHYNSLIPPGSRCCPVHIDSDSFTEEASNHMNNFRKQTDVNRSDIMHLLQKIRENLVQTGNERINFDRSMSDSDVRNLTGLDKVSFQNLLSYLTVVRDTPVRSKRTCLGFFLTKMKTGMSNKLLSTIFNISKDSIRRAISSVRKNLRQTFVPSNIGFHHVTREQVIQDHTRPLAQTLFGEHCLPAILVIDGTYLYIQKSNQFSFQRRSYSLHKHRPLIEAMVFVTTTGYFVRVMGPYLADNSNNDAKIMQHIFATDSEEIRQWMQDGDVFIVDRGFRDSITTLDDIGIRTEMPSFLEKGQKQLSTENSNTSRLVTKIRWVVESANSRIKSWKYFEKVIPNTQIPFIADYIQIICGLCNKYLPPLSSGSQEEDEAVGCKMLHLAKESNVLKTRVENEGLDKDWTQYLKDAKNLSEPETSDESDENVEE